jgi:hypothetical protein
MRERRELVSLLCSLEERSPAAGEASERAARRPKIALRAADAPARNCPARNNNRQREVRRRRQWRQDPGRP